MRTIELYRKHKAGEVSREKFLYEVRRDNNLPWVTNVTSFDDAVKILKNKGIISESHPANDQWFDQFQDAIEQMNLTDDIRKYVMDTLDHVDPLQKYGVMKPYDAAKEYVDDVIYSFQKESFNLNEVDNNVSTDPAVDRVNPYFLKKGVQMLLDKEKELTNDSYIKALNKAALMLQKNPHAFDEEMFANAKDVEKADDKLETEEVKKNNLINKDRQMKKMKGQNIDKANTKVSTKENKKGKPKGVQIMKEEALKDLYNSLKKKELVNEDSHWKHNVGSEVHTPDGPGKVIEIVGGTFTVEMEDGSQKDYQFNTVDHHTQKAQEQEPTQGAQDEPTVKDMWASWEKNQAKPFSGMVGSPEQFKKPLDLSKLKEYIAKHKDDKEKMRKLKEAVKKLKEAGTQITPDGGMSIFVNSSDVAEKEKELKNAGITKYTKKIVG